MNLSEKFNLVNRLKIARSKGAVATLKELLLQTFGPLILLILIVLAISAVKALS